MQIPCGVFVDGERVAPVDDLRSGHAIRQVDLSPPSGAVLPHRPREVNLVTLADPRVDPGDTQRRQSPADDVLGDLLVLRRHPRGHLR